MITSRFIRYAAIVGCAVLLISGCTDRKQLKEEWLQAAAKQEQVTTYQFSGETELQLDPSLFQGMPPLTAAMLSSLKSGRVEYHGKASLNAPVQLEADFTLVPDKSKPADSQTGIPIPLLLKDNKMYMQLPAINKADEYLMFSIKDNENRLMHTGRLTSAISQKLVERVNPDWLNSTGKEEPLPGGESAKRITLSINESSEKEAAAAFSEWLPSILSEGITNGIISEAQSQAWKTALQSVHIVAPSTIDIWIDAKGFVRMQKAELQFVLKEGAPVHKISWTHHIDAINEPMAFTKEAPKQVKSAEDLLRLLPKAAQK